ncbi:hypothetical protein BRD16_09685 [Halobacteriales archaeon SW_6_65_46]|nr:MAG: hypothetical protein BRD16_09685 [Halobacteriales archaeon SW_6_65_46]
MERRKFIIGAGSLAASVAAVTGSGAFTDVSAQRSATVAVADDNTAFLALSQQGSGRRSYEDGSPEAIAFDIPSPDEDDYGGTDPEGLGTDSVYRFSGDAAHDAPGLFNVENRGTQPVQLFGSQAGGADAPQMSIYNVESEELLTDSSPSDPIEVGDSINCGLEIDTHEVDSQDSDYDLTLIINARAVSD